MVRTFMVAAIATALSSTAFAEGFLATKPEKMELSVGLGEAGYGVSKTEFAMTTGKAYALKLKSTGAKECAFEAPEFFNTVWLRKVEVNSVEIKATGLYEVELEKEGEAEMFFVPIKPGEFVWRCRGLADKGMTGKFIVK